MLTPLTFDEFSADDLTTLTGRIAVFADPSGDLGAAAQAVDAASGGAVARAVQSDAFEALKPGGGMAIGFPSGLNVDAVDLVKLAADGDIAAQRRAGAHLAKTRGRVDLHVACDGRDAAQIAYGIVMRDYRFDAHKSDAKTAEGAVRMLGAAPDAAREAFAPLAAIAEGAHMTRDLTNAPANVLTTTAFADQLKEMSNLGLEVEVLDEDQLASLGMRTLLSVGQGSDSPSYVVVMHWRGGAEDAAPLALVGKGVVFDTGGISLKPGAGMEDMTMDMGGAAVVAGVMRSLALRKAAANVVGLVGIVENMPSGTATRPGDVITSMKGDTVEVINTDAEGRLVLCDVMWHAQEAYAPAAMIDLATLTGAIIIGLGHENAGVFSNDDGFCGDFLKAAQTEGEGAWRMPLGKSYDDLLKSRIADMKNIGGRAAGSVTAAQFLQRFVKDGLPWIHLDIAGVASVKSDTELAPKGATGWGVVTINRLISERFEG